MALPRVRIAPAPSGWLHVGNARTALYNWLHARGSGGAFILRVEDTDADRVAPEAYEGIYEALRWLGLDWDEGPGRGGPHGPYLQSERTPLYAAVTAALLQAGYAYDAYETPEELEADRRAAQAQGRPPGYSGAQRDLDQELREAYLAEGRQPVVRLCTPDDGEVSFEDRIRGPITFAWKDVSDFIIQRADGSPTYFLANAVDDLAMGITLVARGEDLLSATPRQLLVYDAVLEGGLLDRLLAENAFPPRPADAEIPAFAHLPLLVGEDRKPLSKRHGAVAVDEFRRQGFLPDTMVNFLALCGWSYDDRRERFEREELTEKFSFDRVGRNPAFFDTTKLRNMNGERIKELSDSALAELLVPYLNAEGLVGLPATPEEQRLLLALAPLLRERIQTLGEALPLVAFCFRDEVVFDDAAVAKHLKGRAGEVLDAAASALEAGGEWSAEAIMEALDGVAESLGLGRGKTFQPVRVAVAGAAVSPPLPETLALLDRAVVVDRIRAARKRVAG
ncbi:MAG TPA: glutamate--tRNA ligase family protein [Egibacteraceae bacterium]|jgi:glutamyl-tRNA synthetase|nr:glutamate--tRNA ligase family protein [Egibacteraceae bacterium]